MADKIFSPGKASHRPLPAAHRTTKLLAAAAATGSVLLLLSGLAFTATVVSLILATPALVLFSPVLVPAGIAIALAAAGFLLSGSFVAAAWVYRYTINGKRYSSSSVVADGQLRRTAADKKDAKEMEPAARDHKVVRVARDAVQWGKELGPKATEITGHAAAALTSS